MSEPLEKTAEKGLIPLVFLDIAFDGIRYRRLDTKEIINGKRIEILQPNLTIMADYSGEGTIKMKPVLEEADGFLFPQVPEPGKLYRCSYFRIQEEEKRKDGIRSVGGGFEIPEE